MGYNFFALWFRARRPVELGISEAGFYVLFAAAFPSPLIANVVVGAVDFASQMVAVVDLQPRLVLLEYMLLCSAQVLTIFVFGPVFGYGIVVAPGVVDSTVVAVVLASRVGKLSLRSMYCIVVLRHSGRLS